MGEIENKLRQMDTLDEMWKLYSTFLRNAVKQPIPINNQRYVTSLECLKRNFNKLCIGRPVNLTSEALSLVHIIVGPSQILSQISAVPESIFRVLQC